MNNDKRVKKLESLINTAIDSDIYDPRELTNYVRDMAPHVNSNTMADALIDLHLAIDKLREKENENKKRIENENENIDGGENTNEKSSEKKKSLKWILKRIIKWMINPIIK